MQPRVEIPILYGSDVTHSLMLSNGMFLSGHMVSIVRQGLMRGWVIAVCLKKFYQRHTDFKGLMIYYTAEVNKKKLQVKSLAWVQGILVRRKVYL